MGCNVSAIARNSKAENGHVANSVGTSKSVPLLPREDVLG